MTDGGWSDRLPRLDDPGTGDRWADYQTTRLRVRGSWVVLVPETDRIHVARERTKVVDDTRVVVWRGRWTEDNESGRASQLGTRLITNPDVIRTYHPTSLTPPVAHYSLPSSLVLYPPVPDWKKVSGLRDSDRDRRHFVSLVP